MNKDTDVTPLSRQQIAWRAAQDLKEGMYVNLGIGVPVFAALHAPADREIVFHSENGIFGVGPVADKAQEDLNLLDAGSQRVTLARGAALVDSAASFALVRGGHIDVTLLGGFQVSAGGDLANWDSLSTTKGPLVGGAMDLATGARALWVLMAHCTKDGAPRLVEQCSYPLTVQGAVDRVYTDLAVIAVTENGFLVEEVVAGLSRDELAARTGAPLAFAADCRTLNVPDL